MEEEPGCIYRSVEAIHALFINVACVRGCAFLTGGKKKNLKGDKEENFEPINELDTRAMNNVEY